MMTLAREMDEALDDHKMFAQLCVEALATLAQSADADGTASRFLRTFHDRSQYPWLGESERSSIAQPGQQLAFAFAYALGTFSPTSWHSADHDDYPALNDDAPRRLTVDEVGELGAAAPHVVDYPLQVESFRLAVKRDRSAREHGTDDLVQVNVQHALEFYVLRSALTVSSDPW